MNRDRHQPDRTDDAAEDSQSDPALNDDSPSDWTDEGGATTAGPATDSDGGRP